MEAIRLPSRTSAHWEEGNTQSGAGCGVRWAETDLLEVLYPVLLVVRVVMGGGWGSGWHWHHMCALTHPNTTWKLHICTYFCCRWCKTHNF
jgi:hypothetical protein